MCTPSRARELYELLAQFPGQIVAASAAIVVGSTDWALGVLANALERYEQAERAEDSAVRLRAQTVIREAGECRAALAAAGA